MDAIFTRSSVRKFTDEKVDDVVIEQLLRAAMAAPSAGNQPPWEFYVVADHNKIQQLATASQYAKWSAAAPCSIVPCVREERCRIPECVPQDMGACIENLLLAAADMGLGACWMGVAPLEDRMASVTQTLGLPQGVSPFAMIAVGWPDAIPTPSGAERYDAKRVHWM